MRKDIADSLSQEYLFFWRQELIDLPDGWIEPLVSLFEKLRALYSIGASTDGLRIMVAMHYRIKPADAMAFASPVIAGQRWNAAQREALIDALSDFHRECQITCQSCGEREAWLRTGLSGEKEEGIICNQCFEEIEHG